MKEPVKITSAPVRTILLSIGLPQLRMYRKEEFLENKFSVGISRTLAGCRHGPGGIIVISPSYARIFSKIGAAAGI